VNRLASTRALEGTAWRFAYLVAQAGISLITFAGLALILPTREFAPASVALGVLVIAGALADLGLSASAISVLPARIARNPAATEQILSGAVKAFSLAAGIALLLPLLVLPGVAGPARLSVLLVAPAAPAYVLVSAADSILRVGGEFRRPVLLVALNRVGGCLALPAASVTGSSAWSCAAIALGTLIATTPAMSLLARTRRAARNAPAADLVRAAWPIGLSQLFVVLGGRANTIILSSAVSTVAAAAFETAWRLFQTGQYFAGAVATGIAPFLGDALGRQRRADLDRLLLRSLGVVTFAGFLFCGLMLAAREQIAQLLVGSLGSTTADVLVPLAIVSPLAFAGFVGTIALAMSRADRSVVLGANALGAVVNLSLAVLLIPTHHALGASIATSIGLAVAQTIVLARVIFFRRRLRYIPGPAQTPPPVETAV
jgi:O-antigen/teichoic acid export membrane protein